MFQAFKDFVSELTGGHKDPSRFEEGDYRLAAAALLVHVGMIDGGLSDAERVKLHTIVKRCFQLDDGAAEALIVQATAAYKRKRRTHAMVAREKGLEPLADMIIAQPTEGSPEKIAKKFINDQVPDVAEALQGARISWQNGSVRMPTSEQLSVKRH